MYLYLLGGIKMRLLLELLLPGCKVTLLPSLDGTHGVGSNTSGTKLIVHRGDKGRWWFHRGFFPQLVSTGQLCDTWYVREEAAMSALDLPPCAQWAVTQGSGWVCEAMPVTHSLREGTGEELGLTSQHQQGPRQKDGRDWLFQVRTGPGVARAQTKANSKGLSNKMSASGTRTA